MPTRRAVYTALFGGYEDLGEQPLAHETDVPFICFTDDPSLTSETWKLELVEPMLPFDMVRSQRDLKIRGNRRTHEFDETLYIDNSVLLREDPDTILDRWLEAKEYAVSLHSYRARAIDEFDEIIALGYDDSARVQEQLIHYAELYPEMLEQQPYWNGIIARRNSETVDRTMGIWFDHVLRYSRRDQLSANVAYWLGGVDLESIDQDNNFSPMHSWPVEVHRRTVLSKASQRKSGPLLAEIARLEREIVRLSAIIEVHPDTLGEIKMLEQELEGAEARIRRLQGDLENVFTSVSWKASRPIRWAGDEIRHLKMGRRRN